MLHRGEGMRQRLYDERGGDSYWPRLMITDASRHDENVPSQPPASPDGPVPPAPMADRLRYLFLGQRARS